MGTDPKTPCLLVQGALLLRRLLRVPGVGNHLRSVATIPRLIHRDKLLRRAKTAPAFLRIFVSPLTPTEKQIAGEMRTRMTEAAAAVAFDAALPRPVDRYAERLQSRSQA